MTDASYQQPDITLLGEEHVRRYQETDGEVGYIWNGATTLLLTTTGRTTGQPRTTPLIFARDGDDYLVVASMGGAPQHPNWYKNLTANAEAHVQVRGEHLDVRASTATEEEKPRLWEIVTAQWPNYDVYQTRTEREIPVVVLTPR
ncbi:MAG TPA: nitroreductase family deazaflavin-dependent oxidoreductase [Acidimicrobiales bacterium]|nr:nitroreductase family deazaflavin-dependent oxidoreductase [Acidimicrobiales bacterium]